MLALLSRNQAATERRRRFPEIRIRRAWLGILSIAAGTAILLMPALLNGFPFVGVDTEAYVGSSFSPREIPIDRPIGYSIFLCFSYAYCPFRFPPVSVWLPVVFQSLIVAYLIRCVLVQCTKSWVNAKFVAVTASVAALTGVAWLAAQLMPDIFTGIGLLALTLMLLTRGDSFAQRMGRLATPAGLLAASVAFHFSNHLIFAGVCVVLAALALLAPSIVRGQQLVPVVACLAAMLLLIPLLNWSLSRQFFYAKSGHVYLMGRLVQDGIIQRELAEHCDRTPFQLCSYRGDLQNMSVDQYVWSGSSPLYKIGGFEGSTNESRRLIGAALRDYPVLNMAAALKGTGRQLVSFRTGDGLYRYPDDSESTWIHVALRTYFPSEYPAFQRSMQQQERFDWTTINKLHQGAFVLALGLLGFLTWHAIRRQAFNQVVVGVVILAGILMNAVVMAVLAGPFDRYQSRVSWLAVLGIGIQLSASLVRPSLGAPVQRPIRR